MYRQIAANKRKTWLLVVGFIAFLAGFGYILSRALGSPGLFTGILVGAVIYALISYFAAAKITVAMTGAKHIAKRDAPELYRIVENLAITAGLPMPKVYIMNDPSPNAFATGRDPRHAIVGVTTGLLEIMEPAELEGVIAHELSHVGNYDIRLMSIVIVLVAVVALIADFFLHLSFWGGGGDDDDSAGALFFVLGLAGAILAPIAASLIQLAISRRREYLADASGVLLTRYPQGLASALGKLAQDRQGLQHSSSATASLYISNPLRGRGMGASLMRLFDTHPPLEDRIAKLQQMETQA